MYIKLGHTPLIYTNVARGHIIVGGELLMLRGEPIPSGIVISMADCRVSAETEGYMIMLHQGSRRGSRRVIVMRREQGNSWNLIINDRLVIVLGSEEFNPDLRVDLSTVNMELDRANTGPTVEPEQPRLSVYEMVALDAEMDAKTFAAHVEETLQKTNSDSNDEES